MVDQQRIEHPQVSYERTDVRFRGVAVVILAALCLAGANLYLVSAFFRQQERRQEAAKAPSYPLAPQPSRGLPPEPRLEQLDRFIGNDAPNVYRRELRGEEALNSYGSTEEAGYIRVPIDRAMDLLPGELPIRKDEQPVASKDDGLIHAGDSNSGRLFRKGPKP